MKKILYLISVIIVFSCIKNTSKSLSLGSASIQLKEKKVYVKNNHINVSWEIENDGMYLTNLLKKDVEIIKHTKAWKIFKEPIEYNLISDSLYIANDDNFTSDYICLDLEFDAVGKGIQVMHRIWLYQNSSGVRTQLFIKKVGGVNFEIKNSVAQTISADKFKNVRYVGYNNDTQHRNKRQTALLKESSESVVVNHQNDWSNIAIASNQKGGLIMVKESHKCSNQKGVNTGGFRVENRVLLNYGLGLDKQHLTNEYQPCWANWMIAYAGGANEAELELKRFDRDRFPINKEKDIYIMSNTWGTGNCGVNSKYNSREDNIIKEIKAAKEIGVDVLQIDDGWQGTGYGKWQTVKTAKYKNNKRSPYFQKFGTEYDVYPEGWKNVKTLAKESGVTLGLWAASWIPYDDLVNNYNKGDFRYYKLDFSHLNNYKKFKNFTDKVRKFVKYTDNKVRVNWDVTENAPRLGYYYGREYGNIYMSNRKPEFPENVIYIPWLVLRDAWHVAKYTNINKFQTTYQNKDLVLKNLSDAYLHSHKYCLMISLMGAPIFFQELQLLSKKTKNEIKPLISLYKQHREQMYDGYTFAIGDEPTNASWTGFQNHNPKTESGYITIFRELKNSEQTKEFSLNFLKGKNVKFKDLISGKTFEVINFSNINLQIDKPSGFKFLSYKIL